MQKELYIVRHGETDENREGLLQGIANNPLNKNGMEQAGTFFQVYGEIEFGAIFTSALTRTSQTLQSFIALGIPHYPLSDLNDMDWGDLNGHMESSDEVRAVVKKWKNGRLEVKIPGGESPLQMSLRLGRARERILKETEARRILICTHSMCIRILLSQLLGTPLEQMGQYNSRNLSLHRLAQRGQSWELITQNDTSHFNQS